MYQLQTVQDDLYRSPEQQVNVLTWFLKLMLKLNVLIKNLFLGPLYSSLLPIKSSFLSKFVNYRVEKFLIKLYTMFV